MADKLFSGDLALDELKFGTRRFIGKDKTYAAERVT